MFLNPNLPEVVNPFRVPSSINYTNAAADWAFYDVSALKTVEFNYLVNQTTIEGSILVALPSNQREMGILKYKDFAALKKGAGKPLQRFSIAGVGSSDVGAAALARSLADFYQEPVGAIVAGYGIADLLQEALGGWFVLGGVNSAMSLFDMVLKNPFFDGSSKEKEAKQEKAVDAITEKSPDTETLFNLLLDDKREILSVAGHSKGCLSIAIALEALTDGKNDEALARAKNIDLVTVGAVVTFPEGFAHIRQFLGSIDWFGGLNSRPLEDRISVPNAWHHLNTSMPYHMDLVEVLKKNQQ
ncbi:MAG: hypothetical protein K6L80_13210 [Agarilytica sp.]